MARSDQGQHDESGRGQQNQGQNRDQQGQGQNRDQQGQNQGHQGEGRNPAQGRDMGSGPDDFGRDAKRSGSDSNR